jgi:tetratricopeptide (TPR) repeat protein
MFFVGCQSFQKQTTQRSAKCGALCAKARQAREQGNPELANQYIDEALRQQPRDVETSRQLAEAMWISGRRKEAAVRLTELCDQQPNDTKLASRLAEMQWEIQQHAMAAKTAESVLIYDPQSKDAWRIKARHEVEQGKLAEALVSYNRLLQLAPDDLSITIELGQLHLDRGYPDRACPLFQSAAQNPQATLDQRTNAEWLLGVAYVRDARWALAVSVLERAITRRNATADDWCFLAWNRLQCGDLTGVEADLRRALERDPDSPAAHNLAWQLEDSKKLQRQPNAVTTTGFQRLSTE